MKEIEMFKKSALLFCMALATVGCERENLNQRGVFCGNGVVDPGEECDLGLANANENSACREDCRDNVCGDGFVGPGEQCDEGAGNSDTLADTCRSDCVEARCGDGVLDSDEECEDGNQQNTDSCLNGCTSARCGDGVVWEGEEECDDGNAIDDDGCSNACVLPIPECANGIVEGDEECDDGNAIPGDGCDPNCVIADGWTCAGVAPSICEDINECLVSDSCSRFETCNNLIGSYECLLRQQIIQSDTPAICDLFAEDLTAVNEQLFVLQGGQSNASVDSTLIVFEDLGVGFEEVARFEPEGENTHFSNVASSSTHAFAFVYINRMITENFGNETAGVQTFVRPSLEGEWQNQGFYSFPEEYRAEESNDNPNPGTIATSGSNLHLSLRQRVSGPAIQPLGDWEFTANPSLSTWTSLGQPELPNNTHVDLVFTYDAAQKMTIAGGRKYTSWFDHLCKQYPNSASPVYECIEIAFSEFPPAQNIVAAIDGFSGNLNVDPFIVAGINNRWVGVYSDNLELETLYDFYLDNTNTFYRVRDVAIDKTTGEIAVRLNTNEVAILEFDGSMLLEVDRFTLPGSGLNFKYDHGVIFAGGTGSCDVSGQIWIIDGR
jgi:cysteine-rich repeat protein